MSRVGVSCIKMDVCVQDMLYSKVGVSCGKVDVCVFNWLCIVKFAQ